ncbi:MAG: NADH-quinone oxidoreductase subunit L [Bacteroidetes bacterium]|nr:NADH-quinone oxidoreductase subunit L [Bacteroidota bacterium]
MPMLMAALILLPFLGFVFNFFLGQRLSKTLSGVIGSATILGSFIIAATFFAQSISGSFTSHQVCLMDWIEVGKYKFSFNFLIDNLSIMMMLIITGIGFLIHVYSIGYMHHDEGFSRFFSYLNLFIFFMLLLVTGANYLILFIGWEGVGLCSYLLIGFWFKNQEYNNAAKKAFIMNRIGDLGFLLGMFKILDVFGSLNFSDVFSAAGGFTANDPAIVIITVLLFIGACGKSAQLPLFTWLPDAMAGPTPVSALIHAATMVTAGVYMVVRSNVLFALSPFTMELITIVGLATALFAGTIALFQNDIKKVLAYSTVSQLGFMFIALGVGAFTTGMFHLMTHAFFKALLFLGAGSVIHAMGGEQDITKMGGLSKKIKITFITFTIGVMAIAGFPFTSGFVSKDEILLADFQHGKIYFILATIAAIMTVFYMFRLWFLTFFGSFRGTHDQEHHLHESPPSMTVPLMVLAILSLVGGFVQFPHIFGGHDYLNQYLSPVVTNTIQEIEGADKLEIEILIATCIGLVILWFITKKNYAVSEFKGEYTGFKKVLADKYYVDEIYEALIISPFQKMSAFITKYVEVIFIDGFVNGAGKVAQVAGSYIRLLQSGHIGYYLFAMVISIVVFLLLNTIIHF